jgi:hypothetical protein
MHVIFQFPIVDFRPMLANYTSKLTAPEWPNPGDNSKSFIRHFGAVEERPSKGSKEWTAEGYFCNTHLSMRYDNLHRQGFPLVTDNKAAIYNSYRRFFSDGYFVNKIEAGFVDNIEKEIQALSPPPKEEINLESVLKHYANLPVTINDKQLKLHRAGAPLAAKYYEESSKKSAPLDAGKYVVGGEIIILLVFASSEAVQLPDASFLIDEMQLPGADGAIKLYGYKLKHESFTIKTWLIETSVTSKKLSPPAQELLRNLRINLLRIHLEKETLRILLNAIKNQKVPLAPGSAEANLVDAYFKKTAEKLFSKMRFSILQEKLLDFALQSEDAVAPGSFSELQEGVHYFEDKFTRSNIEKLLGSMAKKIILFICTSPKDKNPLDFGNEFKQIKDSLRAGTDRNNYKIEIETSVRKDEFLDMLYRYLPDYLHLSMHSSLTEGLYFEDNNKDKLPMPVDEFAEILALFSKKHSPAVILLSACNSAGHAKAVKNYCQYAIGTQAVFPADAGVLYAAKFYAALFEENSTRIPDCHCAGKLAIKGFTPPFDPINNIAVHDIPVLI